MNGTPSPIRVVRDGGYQVCPPLSSEQAAALRADIAERGILVPVAIDEHGNLLDGHNRVRFADELGITDFPTLVYPGLTETEKRSFARKANAMRRQLTRADYRKLVADQLRDTPEWSNNRIARSLGGLVDSKTVAAVRKKLEATSAIPKLTRLVGADGKERPARRPVIMAADLRELQQVLKHAARLPVDQVHGFLSAQTIAIRFSTYNPFEGRSDGQIRNWCLFVWFLVSMCGFSVENAFTHIDWLLRRFETVDEVLGDVGAECRRQWGMTPIPVTTITAWTDFAAIHRDRSRREIERELNMLSIPAKRTPIPARRTG